MNDLLLKAKALLVKNWGVVAAAGVLLLLIHLSGRC